MADYFFNALLAAATNVEVPIDGQTGVWLKSGGVTISSGMKMVGAVVSPGNTQTVYSKGVANACLTRGGTQTVYFGGVVSNTSALGAGKIYISSGGIAAGCYISGGLNAAVLYIHSGGTASSCVLQSGDIQINGYPAPGTAIETVQYGGRGLFNNHANVSNYTISGGFIQAGEGGGPKRIYDLKVYGGNVSIYNNTHVSGAIISGGVVSARTADARFFNASVYSGGTLLIRSGIASNTTVSSGGTAILSGGTLTNCIDEWRVYISSGGVAHSVTVKNSAQCNVYTGGTMTDIVVSSNGRFTVQGGAILSGCTRLDGATYCYILSGGTAYDVHNYYGRFAMSSGGYVSGLYQHPGAGTYMVNAPVRIDDLHIDSDATVVLQSGAVASAVQVSGGASLTVSSGGTALAVTSSAGATVAVEEGGYIEYVTP